MMKQVDVYYIGIAGWGIRPRVSADNTATSAEGAGRTMNEKIFFIKRIEIIDFCVGGLGK